MFLLFIFKHLLEYVMNEAKFFVEPLAGYMLDVLNKVRNRPFIPHSLTKLHNLKYCRDATGATTIVEIGTYKGVTAKRLSRIFKRVVTVEIVPKLHEISKERCRNRKNIELHLGDGSDLLPKIAADVKNAVLFLDGHFSSADTGQGNEIEPVLTELDHIIGHVDNFSAIVVDDFRCFGVDPGWPNKSEVMSKLETVLPSPIWQHYVLNDQFIVIRTPK